MNSIAINNICVFPDKNPAKENIHKEFTKEENGKWIKIWITKCCNICFVCSKNHPIRDRIENHILLISFLYYLIADFYSQLKNNTIEHNLFSSFLNGTLDYIRFHSRNVYDESLKDEYLSGIFSDFILPVNVSVFTLSHLNSNLQKVKKERNELKKNVTDIFSDIKKDLESIEKLIVSKKTNESFTQTEQLNVWNQKIIPKKTIEQKDKSVQNVFTTKNIETQTEIEVKVISQKKKKKEDDCISFTSKQYLDLMKKHNDQIIKTKEECSKNFREDLPNFIKDNPPGLKTFFNICDKVPISNIIDCIMVWSLKNCQKNFYRGLESNGIDPRTHRILIPPFTQFWQTFIFPNLDSFDEPIFEKMKISWIDLNQALKAIFPKAGSTDIDIAFSNCVSNYMDSSFEKLSFVPPFFTILLKSCRNVVILVNMIKVFSLDPKKYENKLQDCLNDFKILFTVESPEDILYKNRKCIIHISQTGRVIYNLDMEPIYKYFSLLSQHLLVSKM